MIEKRQTSLFSGIWREIREKNHQNFAGKMQNSTKKLKKSEIQLFNREKKMAIFDEINEITERCKGVQFSPIFGVVLARSFFPHFSIMDSKTVQRSAFCGSWRELSNEYLLAKFGFDTAEIESCQVRKFKF